VSTPGDHRAARPPGLRDAPLPWIAPDWPVDRRVRAFATTRAGGAGTGPYASLNLAARVGDEPGALAENRRRLVAALALPEEPRWLSQVHGARVVRAEAVGREPAPEADAVVCRSPGIVCAVLTADCLPVLLADRRGSVVGAVHGGWRGLAAGALEAALEAMDRPAGDLCAWLGPAISGTVYEVGGEVRERMLAADAATAACFAPRGPGHYLLDLYAVARGKLQRAGVPAVHGGLWCTLGMPRWFFSYRRDGRCGRMATGIHLA